MIVVCFSFVLGNMEISLDEMGNRKIDYPDDIVLPNQHSENAQEIEEESILAEMDHGNQREHWNGVSVDQKVVEEQERSGDYH